MSVQLLFNNSQDEIDEFLNDESSDFSVSPSDSDLSHDTTILAGMDHGVYEYDRDSKTIEIPDPYSTKKNENFETSRLSSGNINLNIGNTVIIAKAENGKTLANMFLDDIDRGDLNFVSPPFDLVESGVTDTWSDFNAITDDLVIAQDTDNMTDEDNNNMSAIRTKMRALVLGSQPDSSHLDQLAAMMPQDIIDERIEPILTASGYFDFDSHRRASLLSNLMIEVYVIYYNINKDKYTNDIAAALGTSYPMDVFVKQAAERERPALRNLVRQYSLGTVIVQLNNLIRPEGQTTVDFEEIDTLFRETGNTNSVISAAYHTAKEESKKAFRDVTKGGGALTSLLIVHPDIHVSELTNSEAFDMPLHLVNFFTIAQILTQNKLKIYYMTERLEIELDDNCIDISEFPNFMLSEEERDRGFKKLLVRFRNNTRVVSAQPGALELLATFFGQLKVSSMNPDLLSEGSDSNLSSGGLDINFIRELAKLDNFCVLYNRRNIFEIRDDYSKISYQPNANDDAAIKFRGACSTVLYVRYSAGKGFEFDTSKTRMKMIRHTTEEMDVIHERNALYLHLLERFINTEILGIDNR